MFFFQCAVDCTPSDVQQAQNNPDAIIIDYRTHSEALGGSVRGAHVKDWLGGELHRAVSQWDKVQSYYLFSRSGNRSKQAVTFMRKQGFERVFNAGGYDQLRDL